MAKKQFRKFHITSNITIISFCLQLLTSFHPYSFTIENTPRKVSNCRGFSGPSFPVLGVNTGRYGPEKTSYLGTFHYWKHYLPFFSLFPIKIRWKHVFLETRQSQSGFLYWRRLFLTFGNLTEVFIKKTFAKINNKRMGYENCWKKVLEILIG